MRNLHASSLSFAFLQRDRCRCVWFVLLGEMDFRSFAALVVCRGRIGEKAIIVIIVIIVIMVRRRAKVRGEVERKRNMLVQEHGDNVCALFWKRVVQEGRNQNCGGGKSQRVPEIRKR